MVENLTKRVGRIISGSINALVNAIEDASPETVMEEAIREIEKAIDEVRTELGKTIAGKHLANKRLIEKNNEHDTLSDKIQLAVKEKRDDLAEAAIAHQLDVEAQIPVLEQMITSSTEQEKELESYIAALQSKKREMKEALVQYRQSQLQQKSITAENGKSANSANGSNIEKRVSGAASAFERIIERQTGIGTPNTDLQTLSKLSELEGMSRDHRIKERLAIIKQQNGDNQ